MKAIAHLNTLTPLGSVENSNHQSAQINVTSFNHYLYKKNLVPDIHIHNIELFLIFISNNLKKNSLSKNTLNTAIPAYKEHLDRLIQDNPQLLQQRNVLLTSLVYFIEYLYEVKTMDVRPKFSLLQLSQPIFDDLGCNYFREYIHSFIERNYTNVSDKIDSIKHFLRNISIPTDNLEILTLEHLKLYEKHYTDRAVREEITKQTARVRLDQIKNFLIFLRNHNVIHFQYKTPEFLFGAESRDNEFVSNDTLLQYYKTLKEVNAPALNLCIFLLLVETGCRPIEICNLKISDFNYTESEISFGCLKSDKRVLKIDSYIKNHLHLYIKNQRKCSLPNETIFCNKYGNPLITSNITKKIKYYNELAFGRIEFSAKSLRHTFITNALNEKKHPLDLVSKSVGHDQWRSTIHYLFRDHQLLLDNTLQFNPHTKE